MTSASKLSLFLNVVTAVSSVAFVGLEIAILYVCVKNNSNYETQIRSSPGNNYCYNNTNNTFPIPDAKKYTGWWRFNDDDLAIIEKYSPIIEMCAGDGHLHKALKERGVDIISFDSAATIHDTKTDDTLTFNITSSSNNILVKFALCGTIEDQHSNRTLMIMAGFNTIASVEKYRKAGGKRVIIGGYIQNRKQNIDGLVIRNNDGKFVNIDDPYLEEVESYYQLNERPTLSYMRDHWTLVSTTYHSTPLEFGSADTKTRLNIQEQEVYYMMRVYERQ